MKIPKADKYIPPQHTVTIRKGSHISWNGEDGIEHKGILTKHTKFVSIETVPSDDGPYKKNT